MYIFPFNPGDRVICINNSNYEDDLTLGREYVLNNVARDYVAFISDTGIYESAYAWRFKLSNSNKPIDLIDLIPAGELNLKGEIF